MTNQKPQMSKSRKEFPRAEMLACASEARYLNRRGNTEEAARWSAIAAKRLEQLGGMAARW